MASGRRNRNPSFPSSGITDDDVDDAARHDYISSILSPSLLTNADVAQPSLTLRRPVVEGPRQLLDHQEGTTRSHLLLQQRANLRQQQLLCLQNDDAGIFRASLERDILLRRCREKQERDRRAEELLLLRSSILAKAAAAAAASASAASASTSRESSSPREEAELLLSTSAAGGASARALNPFLEAVSSLPPPSSDSITPGTTRSSPQQIEGLLAGLAKTSPYSALAGIGASIPHDGHAAAISADMVAAAAAAAASRGGGGGGGGIGGEETTLSSILAALTAIKGGGGGGGEKEEEAPHRQEIRRRQQQQQLQLQQLHLMEEALRSSNRTSSSTTTTTTTTTSFTKPTAAAGADVLLDELLSSSSLVRGRSSSSVSRFWPLLSQEELRARTRRSTRASSAAAETLLLEDALRARNRNLSAALVDPHHDRGEQLGQEGCSRWSSATAAAATAAAATAAGVYHHVTHPNTNQTTDSFSSSLMMLGEGKGVLGDHGAVESCTSSSSRSNKLVDFGDPTANSSADFLSCRFLRRRRHNHLAPPPPGEETQYPFATKADSYSSSSALLTCLPPRKERVTFVRDADGRDERSIVTTKRKTITNAKKITTTTAMRKKAKKVTEASNNDDDDDDGKNTTMTGNKPTNKKENKKHSGDRNTSTTSPFPIQRHRRRGGGGGPTTANSLLPTQKPRSLFLGHHEKGESRKGSEPHDHRHSHHQNFGRDDSSSIADANQTSRGGSCADSEGVPTCPPRPEDILERTKRNMMRKTTGRTVPPSSSSSCGNHDSN